MNRPYFILRCWAAPMVVLLPLMPLMQIGWDQVPQWFRGPTFLTLVAQFLSSLLSGVANAVIFAFLGGGGG